MGNIIPSMSSCYSPPSEDADFNSVMIEKTKLKKDLSKIKLTEEISNLRKKLVEEKSKVNQEK